MRRAVKTIRGIYLLYSRKAPVRPISMNFSIGYGVLTPSTLYYTALRATITLGDLQGEFRKSRSTQNRYGAKYNARFVANFLRHINVKNYEN